LFSESIPTLTITTTWFQSHKTFSFVAEEEFGKRLVVHEDFQYSFLTLQLVNKYTRKQRFYLKWQEKVAWFGEWKVVYKLRFNYSLQHFQKD
jgi:hypothetical protein